MTRPATEQEWATARDALPFQQPVLFYAEPGGWEIHYEDAITLAVELALPLDAVSEDDDRVVARVMPSEIESVVENLWERGFCAWLV